nr:hypothetical protein [Sphingomonadaceae bacterium]
PLPADRGYDKDSPRTEAINAPNRGEVAAANAAGGAQANANAAADTRANANAQVAYDYDMANYVTALRAHDQAAVADARHYDRQQRAYADAMRAWRIQVYDCSRGITAACRAPTPDPAAFW